MKYMTTKETEKNWGISERRIRQLLQEGRIEGAIKVGSNWNIPASASKPVDKRIIKPDEENFIINLDDDYFDEDDEFDGDFREIVCDILNHRISKMTKSEAQSALHDIIESAPEWMLRDFVNNWI